MKTINEYLFSKKSDLDKLKTNRFGITEKDMIRALEGFPVGVVVKMMEEQEKQWNKSDVKIFQKNRSTGFSWYKTEDGTSFWYQVLSNDDFDLFYKKYPEYKKYDL